MYATPLIIDTDPGVDDALAILFAINRGCDVRGLSVIGGNVPLDRCIHNALSVLTLLGRTDIPVFHGADKPLMVAPYKSGESHGPTGLGEFTITLPSGADTKDSSVNGYRQILQNPATILAIGPTTNIAAFLRQEPAFATQIERLIIMGGSFDGKGNVGVSPEAEFNVYCDPHALAEILMHPIDITIIPAEICRHVTVTLDQLNEAMGMNDQAKAMHQIMDSYIRYYQTDATFGGFNGGVLYDLLTVSYLLHPEYFETVAASVSVVTEEGPTRGKTSIIPEGTPNCRVATKVNGTAVTEDFLESLRTTAFHDGTAE